MTYSDLLDRIDEMGLSCGDIALGRMMDIVEEQTGKWPSWEDKAPAWILKQFGVEE